MGKQAERDYYRTGFRRTRAEAKQELIGLSPALRARHRTVRATLRTVEGVTIHGWTNQLLRKK